MAFLLDFDPTTNLTSPSEIQIILQGYVTKVGSWFGGNAMRWIVLRSDFTLLSAISIDEALSPTKSYSLIGCEVEWGKLATSEYAVRIKCRRQSLSGKIGKKKELTLIVEDQGSMNMWVGGLRCLFAGTNRILCTENEMGGESCSICLADFEAGEDLVILPCEHRFCSNGCIENWLRISSKCPNCKQDSKVCGEPMLRRGKWRDVDTGETKQ